jgi:hypothetical protein
MPKRNEIATRLLRATLLTFMASLIFWAFFQLSKSPAFAAVNPFAEDPVDAIGSIAVQVALAVSLLSAGARRASKPNGNDIHLQKPSIARERRRASHCYHARCGHERGCNTRRGMNRSGACC